MQLNFTEAQKLLHKYNIKFADFAIAGNVNEAGRAADQLGFPLAVKAISPDVLHKTEAGCVITNLNSKKEVIAAYYDIRNRCRKMNARFDGAAIQKMAYGKEIIIGGKTDPQFGPVVLFGLGGIFVEVIKDFAVRIAPINQQEALEMMKEIRGYRILTGARGEKTVNLKSIAKTIVAVSQLLADHAEIKEMDLNPLFVNEKDCIAVDVRMIL